MAGQASVMIDVSAQVTGYQESLNKLKESLNKIDLNSDFGQRALNTIQKIQKQINDLDKNSKKRVTSEAGIERITGQAASVGQALQEVANMMNSVTVENLDLSKLSSDTQEAINKARELHAQLDQSMGAGIQSMIADSQELKSVLESLGVDLNSLNADNFVSVLSAGLNDLETRTTDLKARISELFTEIGNLKRANKELEDNPVLKFQKSFDSKLVKNYLGEDYFNQINKLAEQAKSKTTDTSYHGKIDAAFLKLLDAKSLSEARAELELILKNWKELGFANKTTLEGIIGRSGQHTKFLPDDLLTFDPKIVAEKTAEIQDIINQVGSSFSSDRKSAISTFLESGDIKSAADLTVKELRDATNRIKTDIENNNRTIEAKLAEKRNAETASQNNPSQTGIIENAQKQVDALKDKNKQLQEQADQQDKIVQQLLNKEASGVKGTAGEVFSEAAAQINQATEAYKRYNAELEKGRNINTMVGKVEGVVQRWFSVYAAVRMVSNAVRSVISTVKELDKTITEIAIVTDKTQPDLWKQMPNYTNMARQYASSISGVYKVSQLYYQQGLEQSDVMALTEETLKMARISGLDYATATDYMTNAVRSFKMEMQDAQTVVDVYSNIAASSATSTTELATAMSKTASSAAAVGSSFENTTAMMAVMIEATREAPENIGSAMKSIISRYGELKENPVTMIDSEGEELSLNKVDTALKSIGITIQDTEHQFRDFDDVIMELAQKWDTIDKNTQRYIATVMAGNRQQSRFLALVSNGERLAELSEEAANSEDTATLQVLKTMDSIEAKTQQLQTSLQSLYTSSGVETLYKGVLDFGNNIVKSLTEMSTVAGIPVAAITQIGLTFFNLANIVTNVFALIKAKAQINSNAMLGIAQTEAQQKNAISLNEANEKIAIYEKAFAHIAKLEAQGVKDHERFEKIKTSITQHYLEARIQASPEQQAMNEERKRMVMLAKQTKMSLGFSAGSLITSALASSIEGKNKEKKFKKGLLGTASTAFSGAAMGAMSGGTVLGLPGAAVGAIAGGVLGIIQNWNLFNESVEATSARLKEASTNANNTYIQKKADYQNLQQQIEKLKELEKARYDSAEANEEYLKASNELASSYPELIDYIDQEGNSIINLANEYDALSKARMTAQQAAIDAAKAAAVQAENDYNAAKNNENKNKITAREKWKDTELSNGERVGYGEILGKTSYGNELPTFTFGGIQKGDVLAEFYKKFFDESLNKNNTAADKSIYQYLANITSVIMNGTAEEIDQAVLENKDVLNKIKKTTQGNDLIQAYFSLIEEVTGNLSAIEADINQKNSLAEAANRTAIANSTYWVSQAKLNDKNENADFLKEFDAVNDVINSYVYTQFEQFKKDNATMSFKEGESWYSKFREATSDGFNTAYENIYKEIQSIWGPLGTEGQKNDFNKLIGDRNLYTKEQFNDLLDNYSIGEDSKLRAALLEYYETAFDSREFIKAINARGHKNGLRINDFYDKTEEIDSLIERLGEEDLRQILDVYDIIDKKIGNKDISQKLGQDVFNAYLTLWDTTTQMGEEGEKAQALLTNWDDFSLTGLANFFKLIDDSSLSEDAASDLKKGAEKFVKSMPTNLTTELQSYAQKVTTNIEDFEKALSNSTKGMDLKTATELTQKTGKTLNDFDFKEGKFFFDDFDALKEAYFNENEELKNNIKDAATNLKNNFRNVGDLRFDSLEKLDQWLEKDSTATYLQNNNLTVDQFRNYYEQYLSEANTKTQTFTQWVAQNINEELAASLTKIDEYIADATARSALVNGDFDSFLKVVKPLDGGKTARNALKSGNIDSLAEQFPKYASEIIKNYQNINNEIYNSITSGAGEYVEANQFNAAKLGVLEQKGLLQKISGAGAEAVYKTIQITNSNIDELLKMIQDDKSLSNDEKASQIQKAFDEAYQNPYEIMDGLVEEGGVSIETMTQLAEMLYGDASKIKEVEEQFDLHLNTVTGRYAHGEKSIENIEAQIDKITSRENYKNRITNTIDDLKAEKEQLKTAREKASKADKIEIDNEIAQIDQTIEELQGEIANYVGHILTPEEIKEVNELFAQAASLTNKPLRDRKTTLEDTIKNMTALTEENVSDIATNIFGMRSDSEEFKKLGLFKDNGDGTSTLNVAALRKAISENVGDINDELQQLLVDTIQNQATEATKALTDGVQSKEDRKKIADSYKEFVGTDLAESAWDWDADLNAFTLSAEAYTTYINALAAGTNNAQEAAAILETARDSIIESMDISGFVSDVEGLGGRSGRVLKKQLTEYYKMQNTYNPLSYDNVQAYNNEMIRSVENDLKTLRSGGNEAVDVLKRINPEATQEQIEEVFYAQVNRYQEGMEQLSEGLQVNARIADEEIRNILVQHGFEFDANGVVTTVGNLIEGVQGVYEAIKTSGESTTTQINKAYSDYLTTRDKTNNNISSLLSDAYGMAYEEFGKIIGNLGIDFETVLNDSASGVVSNGFGGINIVDFKAFSDKYLTGMLPETSQEYTKLLSAYTDSSIEYMGEYSKAVAEQLSDISSAKVGQKVNVQYLLDLFRGEEETLEQVLGGSIENGILTVNGAIKEKLFSNLKGMRDVLEAKGDDTFAIDEMINEFLLTAQSEISSASIGGTLSAETASVLASYNGIWADKIRFDGTAVLESADDLYTAAIDVYTAVKESFEDNKSDLQTLNNAYATIIKASTSEDAAVNAMLSSAANLSTDTLNKFMTSMGFRLESMLDRNGDVINGWQNSIERTGLETYQIKDWDRYIIQAEVALGHKLDQTTSEYINSYISWLDSEANVAPNAKEALMTSLVPNLDKLSYAQIGQIAKTFDLTVDSILKIVEDNGDKTFNADGLLSALEGKFNQDNESFVRALNEQKATVLTNFTNAVSTYISSQKGSTDIRVLRDSFRDFDKAVQALGFDLNLTIEELTPILDEGGAQAVGMMSSIAKDMKQQLSAQDVETIYRAQVSSYVNAIDTVISGPGAIIDATTASIINATGGKATELAGTGQYVVETAANLYEAYNKILSDLKATGEATLADINKVAALALENKDGEQQAIDALGDAAGMTYTRFGEILAQAGYELSEDLVNQLASTGVIKQLGGSKMQIADFSVFADLMGWDANSEEYVSAFKSYNDSMIEMNHQVEKNILEETKSVMEAAPGEQINLTQLSSKLNETQSAALTATLARYGAQLKDGILTLDEDANIVAISHEIQQYSSEYGGLLSSELAELSDSILSLLDNYINLISNGLSGTLTNTDANSLQAFAKNLDIDLDFTKTAEGLRLSRDNAIDLYNAFKQIDSIKATQIFDSLYESMTGDLGSGYDNMADTMATISELQSKIVENEAEMAKLRHDIIASPDSTRADTARLGILERQTAELEKQLGLAQEIGQKQMTDPESYNFMNGKLPDYLQGPANYWDSVGKAYKTMNEAAKNKNMMDLTDYYNIVNEMANLAALSGNLVLNGQEFENSAEYAAYLINAGCNALTNVDGEGVKVNLSNLGIDFLGGADSMQGNFEAGVKSLAESQIAMLDAAIQLLETIVAMEQLSDIDVEGDGIQIDNLFGIDGSMTEGFATIVSDIVDKIDPASKNYNEGLAQALENVKLGNHSLAEIFRLLNENPSQGQQTLEGLGISGEQFTAVMNAYLNALKDGSYDLETIQQSIYDNFRNAGLGDLGITIDIGEQTVSLVGKNTFTIDWTKDSLKELAEGKFGKNKNKDGKTPVEQLKEEYKKGMEKLSTSPTEIDAGTLDLLVEITGNIGTPVEKGGKWHFNGQTYESKEAAEEAARKKAYADLIDQYKGTEGEETYDAETQTYTTTKTIPMGLLENLIYEITIDSEGNATTVYKGPNGRKYDSPDDYLLEKFIEDNPQFSPESMEAKGREGTPEEIKNTAAFKRYKMRINPGEISIEGNDDTKAKALEALKQGILPSINETAEGYEIEIDGLKLKVNSLGDLVGSDGQLLSGEDLSQKLQETFEGDLNLQSTALAIQKGIEQSMTGENGAAIGQALMDGIKQGLEGLTAIEPGQLPEVATAMGKVATQAQTLAGINWDLIAEGIKKVAGANGTGGENPSTPGGGTGNPTGGTGGMNLQLTSLELSATSVNLDTVTTVAAPSATTIEANTLNTGGTTIDANGSTFTGTLAISKSSGDTGSNGGESGKGGNGSNNKKQGTPKTPEVEAPAQVDTTGLQEGASQAQGSMDVLGGVFSSFSSIIAGINLTPMSDNAATLGTNATNAASPLGTLASTVGTLISKLTGIPTSLPTLTLTVSVSVTGTGATGNATGLYKVFSKGNVGKAFAAGKGTLMGELGPELVVSGGRYFLAGENGAEFVDLDKDAIVFNHLQTKKLMTQGHGGRGKAFTNEKNATTLATGNVSGPALASASAALAALKQIRAMWQRMLDASAKDLGSQAGRGGGGGGGGGGGDDAEQPTTTTDDIQRWYNWLRQIDHIEMHITEQEKLQTKYENDRIANGEKIYQTQKSQLELLDQEIVRNQKLADLQKKWYDNKRKELEESSYGKIFTYDEYGLQQYTGNDKPGSGVGLDILENLTRRNVNGQAIDNAATAKKQLAYLQSVGFNLSDLLYNDDGTKVAKSIDKNLKLKKINKKDKDNDLYTQMMENFWNNVDAWRDELDSLYDSYHEQLEKVIDNQTKQNEILQTFVDNELDVEQKLLEAVEAREQAVIDKLQEQKDALEKSNERYIKGLTDSLNKEKDMRQQNDKDTELTKLQRQLAILQRSGGSASQIKSLQDQISSKQQDAYYDARQQEIDAIQEASDKQLEKLDTQIDLLTQTLEYQKANGLLWNDVRQIMAGGIDAAVAFYSTWTGADESTLQQSEDIKDFKEAFQEWKAYETDKTEENSNNQRVNAEIAKNAEVEDNKSYLNKMSATEQEEATALAQSTAKNSYDTAIKEGKTEEEAMNEANIAYASSIKTSYSKSQAGKTEQENQKKGEEIFETWAANEAANANTGKSSFYNRLNENEKDIFKENYIEEYLKAKESGKEDEEAAITALTNAQSNLQSAVHFDNVSFVPTSDIQAYEFIPKKGKTAAKMKAKAKLAAGVEQTAVDIKAMTTGSGKKKKTTYYLRLNNGLYVPVSSVPNGTTIYNQLKRSNELANLDQLSATDSAITSDALDNYNEKLRHFNESITLPKNGALSSNISTRMVDAEGKVTETALTTKKKLKKATTFNIASINGAGVNSSNQLKFDSITVDKLSNGAALKTPLTITQKQLQTMKQYSNILAKLRNIIPQRFKTGGMADFTGPAWMDGTTRKPEAVLNAAQTEFLRKDLLGNSSTSLISIVSALQDAINNTAAGTNSTSTTDDSVVIENVSVTFEAGTIASDYDARRAGELFKEELVKIARKAGNNSVSRR